MKALVANAMVRCETKLHGCAFRLMQNPADRVRPPQQNSAAQPLERALMLVCADVDLGTAVAERSPPTPKERLI